MRFGSTEAEGMQEKDKSLMMIYKTSLPPRTWVYIPMIPLESQASRFGTMRQGKVCSMYGMYSYATAYRELC